MLSYRYNNFYDEGGGQLSVFKYEKGWISAKLLLKGKDKAVPLEAWSDPEGSRFPDFMTTAQEGGKVVSLTHRPHLPPGNSPGTHFC